jgi:hypothetical protein
MSASVADDGSESGGPLRVNIALLANGGTEYLNKPGTARRASAGIEVLVPLKHITFERAVATCAEKKHAAFLGSASCLIVTNNSTALEESQALYARFGDLARLFPRVSDLRLQAYANGVDIEAFLAEVNKLHALTRLEFRAWSNATKESKASNLQMLAAFVQTRHRDPTKASISHLTVIPGLVPLRDPKNEELFDRFVATLGDAGCSVHEHTPGHTAKQFR